MTATFIVRNNPGFVKYVKSDWHYFLRKDRAPGCSITIRNNDVFIHIDRFYCVIFNCLKFIHRNQDRYALEMDNKAKAMLNDYLNL